MDLYVIAPQAVTDATLADASMAEDDATTAWDAGTTYAAGERVHSPVTHTVYEARTTTTGADPATAANIYDPDANPTGVWIDAGATNRWRPFDKKASQAATGTADLVWTIRPASTITALAALNVEAASVRVSVWAPLTPGTIITDETVIGPGGVRTYHVERHMTDVSGIHDAWTYRFADIERESSAVFQAIPAYAGTTLIVEVVAAAGAARSVGEIVLGYEQRIARVLTGPQIGLTDYSRKDFDEFGNAVIIPRAYAQTTTYPLQLTATEVARAFRRLADLRATPAVYHVGEDNAAYGLTCWGFLRDLPFRLESGPATFLNLEVEGLI